VASCHFFHNRDNLFVMNDILPPPASLSVTPDLKLSELISALSHALDITEGQPEGHCVRCCWIGMHIGRVIGIMHGLRCWLR